MKALIRLDRPVIVEGKYDKITLENVIDALIIPTDGFGIFKNPEKTALISHAYFRKPVSHAVKNLRLFTEGSPSIHPSDR